jgi:quercetin dioxygenase-like cupin family protein
MASILTGRLERRSNAVKKTRLALLAAALASTYPAFAADSVVTANAEDASAKWTECGDPWPKGCEYIGLWGDAEKSPIGSYVRAPKGYIFLNHSHPSTEHILVLKGVVKGGVVGGPEISTLPGMYIGYPANAPHWARCEEACLMYIVYDKAPYGVKFH